MVGRGGGNNLVARRFTDDLMEISGETSPSKYMRIFIEKQITDRHWFIVRMRDEVGTLRNHIGQLTALIAEFEASGDVEKVFNQLMELRGDRSDEEDQVVDINRMIVATKEQIHKKDTDLEKMKDEGNDC